MTNHTDLLRRVLELLDDWHGLDGQDILYTFPHDRIDDLRDHLRTAIETGGWMPIDEKAKDGTWWLCLHESGHRNIMQFCSEGFWRTNCDVVNMGWNPIKYMPVPPTAGTKG